MHESLMLALAALASLAGFGWLALAMEVHWEQVQGRHAERSPAVVKRLRVCGVLGLVASLVLCLWVDHASMASLVWVMLLAAAAATIAFALTWRAQWLRLLVRLVGSGGAASGA
ncbi:MAG: DUF3325 domain-containing protein [Rhizobacter sp.]